MLTNLGLDANGNQIQAIPASVAEQSTGDIVVAVGLGGPGSGLVRYLPDGTRDTIFGTGGFAALPVGNSSTRPALAVQPDGKLVWAGKGTASNGSAVFAVVRFNANGTLDQTLGTGGLVTTTFGNALQALRLSWCSPTEDPRRRPGPVRRPPATGHRRPGPLQLQRRHRHDLRLRRTGTGPQLEPRARLGDRRHRTGTGCQR